MSQVVIEQTKTESITKSIAKSPLVQSLRTVPGGLTAGLLAFNWIYPLSQLRKLPETIPLQYDFDGAASWSGSKYLLLMLPVVATFNYLKPYLFPKSPEATLYPLPVSKAKPEAVSKVANIFTKANGIIKQFVALAGTLLAIKGIDLSQKTRSKWVVGGVAAIVFVIAVSYAEAYYFITKDSQKKILE